MSWLQGCWRCCRSLIPFYSERRRARAKVCLVSCSMYTYSLFLFILSRYHIWHLNTLHEILRACAEALSTSIWHASVDLFRRDLA